MIVWKDVMGFEGLYEISNLGIVRSRDRKIYHSKNKKHHNLLGRMLSTRVNNCGYISVRLCKEGRVYTKLVHRLLAEAFIPNPEGKKYVNHIDGIKTNNSLDNLEFVTHSENMKHAYAIGLIKPKKRSKIPDTFKIPGIYRFKTPRIKNDIQVQDKD